MPADEHDFFYRLTPDEIIDAAVKLGLEPSGHVAQLNSMENRVFDLRLENGQHVVMKFYRPGRWSRPQILEEHAFLFDLTENDVPALAPLKFSGQSLFAEQGIHFAIWPRTGGREPEELSEIDLQILGRLLARLHNVGAARSFPKRTEAPGSSADGMSSVPATSRPVFTAERFVHEPVRVLKEKKYLSPKFQSHYEDLAEIVAAAFKLRVVDVPLLPIHGDLHKGNILNGVDGWFLLDFDDSVTGPAVQDVWMMFPGASPEALQARETFLTAYREFREFENSWLRLAEVLRAMRIIHYSGWIARRYDDPAFLSAFPSFADDAYWEEEIGVLSDICAGLGDGPTTGLPEEKLGNKDFFFDWQE